jgi:hypothetical protein
LTLYRDRRRIAMTETLFDILKTRFQQNPQRHCGLSWEDVAPRLSANPDAQKALAWMEETGGEPDVIGADGDRILFADCTKESPSGRRSLCYDDAALKARKKNPPVGSASAQAQAAGVSLMSEEQYRRLQSIEAVDLKTSSWIKTPEEIRTLGGALFCERRYDTVFVFHNSAESYYGVRGWRGVVSV